MAQYETEYWVSDGQGHTYKERQSGTYHPYAPDRLTGQDFDFCSDTVAAISQAEAAVHTLDAASNALTDTESLARLILRAEAVASSRIEGLEISARKLLREEALQKMGKRRTHNSVTSEVIGNINAMIAAIEKAVSHKQITLDTFCDIHRNLVAGTSLEDYGGMIRTEQNWVGGNPYNPLGADYVPPRPNEVEGLLKDLAQFCNEERFSPLAQAALVHAQFETIHPFVDGNGRTGRALIHMVLRRRRLAERAVPPISLVLATYKRDYVHFLGGYRYEGSAGGNKATLARNEWVEFFCGACTRACQSAQAFEARITNIQEGWHSQVGARKNSAAYDLIELLPGMPVISIESAAIATNRSIEAVRLAVSVLMNAGILSQTSQGKRNRIFEAREVLDEFTYYERSLATQSGDTHREKPQRPVPYR
jgi:Fic family protein